MPADDPIPSGDKPEPTENVGSGLSPSYEYENDESLSRGPEGTKPEVIIPVVEAAARQAALTAIEYSYTHRGWLPPPHQLAEYDRVMPGLARQIVDFALAEQSHRHAIDNKETDSIVDTMRADVSMARSAQVFGFIFLPVLVVAAVVLAVLHVEIGAIGLGVVAAVTTFGSRIFAPRRATSATDAKDTKDDKDKDDDKDSD